MHLMPLSLRFPKSRDCLFLTFHVTLFRKIHLFYSGILLIFPLFTAIFLTTGSKSIIDNCKYHANSNCMVGKKELSTNYIVSGLITHTGDSSFQNKGQSRLLTNESERSNLSHHTDPNMSACSLNEFPGEPQNKVPLLFSPP